MSTDTTRPGPRRSARGFRLDYARARERGHVCPHCGATHYGGAYAPHQAACARRQARRARR